MKMSGDPRSPADLSARIITALFHPLLMPLYGLLIIFYAPTMFGYIPENQKKYMIFILAANNIVLPLALLPYMKWRKLITTWTMTEKKERIFPMAFTSFFYFMTFFAVLKSGIPLFVKAFILAAALLSFILTIINFWYRISIHSAGTGALTALIIILSLKTHAPLLPFLLPAFLVSGLILSSRLWLNAHKPDEVWLGYLTGFAGMILLLLVF
ncbi:MAG: hypothetical protein MUE74_04960 [Bacteroidales bacterium]|nr:hypothetical protein [Bacteroidales bacterium]